MAMLSSFNLRLPFSKTKLQSVLSPQQHAYLTTKSSGLRMMASSKPAESAPSTIPDHHREEMKPEEGTDSRKSMNTKPERKILSNVWREIHGQNDWEGLLGPMDAILRSELIKYGEMAQACYDAFDFDIFSKYYGSCWFTKQEFSDSLGLQSHGYEISRYLYATFNVKLPNFFKLSRLPHIWSERANWIGYIAVSNDEMSQKLGRRDVTISWRGTVTRLEWIVDLMNYLRGTSSDKIPSPDPLIKVESGFLDFYTDKDEKCTFSKFSAREQVLTEINRLIEMYPNEELSITLTGHSLGSALATLSAYDIAETGVNIREDGRAVPICVYSFSGPRVGNLRFKERVEKLGVKVLRIFNVHDIVPRIPGLFFNENIPMWITKQVEKLPWSYSHVGVELELDHTSSPFLKRKADPATAHNLEALLHLLAGYQGKHCKFEQAHRRDHALVNKSSDFLEDYNLIPPNWRQYENRRMVRNAEGWWTQPERPKSDDHPEDMHRRLKKMGLSG